MTANISYSTQLGLFFKIGPRSQYVNSFKIGYRICLQPVKFPRVGGMRVSRKFYRGGGGGAGPGPTARKQL